MICEHCRCANHALCYNRFNPQTGEPRATDVRPNWCTCQHKLPRGEGVVPPGNHASVVE